MDPIPTIVTGSCYLSGGPSSVRFPDAIDAAVEEITNAKYLSAAQKRDIFYNNAARFFRLKKGQPASLLAR